MSKIERGVALVTGASSGIGLVTARRCGAMANVSSAPAENRCLTPSDGITMLICDVIDDASVQSVIDEIL